MSGHLSYSDEELLRSPRFRQAQPGQTACAFEGCGRVHYGLGYCHAHYQQSRRGVTLAPVQFRRRVGGAAVRDESGRKHCPRCREWLAEERYSKMSSAMDGLYPYCKDCVWLEQLPATRGITADQYAAMLREQGDGCAICGAADERGRRLSVDHDHSCCPGHGKSCGKCVRGLLCGDCNRALGLFRDDPELLTRAASYLTVRSDSCLI